MAIKELITKGLLESSESLRGLHDVKDSYGRVIWDNTLETLSEAIVKLKEDPSVIVRETKTSFPLKGLSFVLGSETMDAIWKESKGGYVAVNAALKLYAAFCDNDYWPNRGSGGH